MMRVLEANAPPKQTATDTISTLSSRLASATLLEDRRAAILGLRSFAKEYPASVASGALRGLIASLTKDADDVDTLKVVLETLLALFHPNDASPEAADEIHMWLADEFTMRQDNMTVLLDLLDTPDLYSRLYPLQLIRACADARPERTQECIQTAPMGTSRLAAMLDDPRDMVRNEALAVLSDLTRASTELQKVFVFEDVFAKVFSMIHADGGLTQGGLVVQDCLSLLANLIRFNPSNQMYFMKMEYPRQFVSLLPGASKASKANKARGPAADDDDDWVSPQSDKNVWGLLIIMRMFLVKGSAVTPQNQAAFVQYGLVRQLLHIAFDPATAMLIKVEALSTCADLIRGNPRMQEGFAAEQVRPFTQPAANGAATPNGVANVYVIEALLNLVLTPASNDLFDIRNAAADVIKAYFYNHPQIREHFLRRAIGGHEEGDDTQNSLTILMEGSHASPGDPYRIWFAATLMFDLIFDNLPAKHLLMQVKEGDADSGEEVVTCIQTLTANLIASLQLEEDERISIGYLMLLLGWLFEDAAAVDDFLGEASSLQSLVQAVLRPGSGQTINRGLCAALLGTIYEFSTKDSPVPRRQLQDTLTGKLGREKYLNAITELRNHPLIRDFEVLPQRAGGEGSLPDVFFVDTCVDFLKDNFSRLTRAIDRNPNIEQHQSDEGVDRNVIDDLRSEIDGKDRSIQELKAQLMALEQKLDQEHADHRKTQQAADEQRNTLKRINDKLHNDLDTEIKAKDRDHKKTMLEYENKFNLQIAALNNKLQQAAKESTLAVSRTKQEYDEKLHEAHRSSTDLQRRLESAEKARSDAFEKIQQLEKAHQQARNELSSVNEALRKAQAQSQQHDAQIQHLTEENQTLQSTIDKLRSDHQTVIDKLKSEHQAHILELEAANEAANQSALDKLKATHQSATDKLTSSHKSELEKLKSEHKAATDVSTKQITTQKSSLDKLTSEITALKTQLQDQTWKATEAGQKLAKAEAATKDVQEKLKKAEAAAKDAGKKDNKKDDKAAEVSKKLIKDMQDKVKHVEDKLKKAEEAEKEKQTELDDLFVMLQELEEKRSADKKRLKELGEEVSEGEEDDDDDDDEDEDEDED
ncbi:hypothetical protein E8E12_010824 [Didymella heteroderae]|uniref:Intracellular protein transport n=1 Tax=Didymella heteroderae TaxID=1769908 RepID=A0A9P4WX44_9PLEO|nr:hypothetical protein E8E12_010824 [Didymella heteroderae]